MEFRYVFLDNYYSLKNNECTFSIRHGLKSLKKVRVTIVAWQQRRFKMVDIFPLK